MPKDPQSMEEFIIPDYFQATGKQEAHNFLIFDNGNQALNRIIIFSNHYQLRILAESERFVTLKLFNSINQIYLYSAFYRTQKYHSNDANKRYYRHIYALIQ